MIKTRSSEDPSPHQPKPREEISLWEVREALRTHWKIIVAFTLGFPILAFVAALNWPKQYEASALLEVAHVGVLHTAINGGGGALTEQVESPADVIVRVQSRNFRARVSSSLQNVVTLNAQKPKDSKLLEITVRAPSASSASEILLSAITQLSEDHAEKLKENAESLRRALKSTRAERFQVSELLSDLPTQIDKLSKLGPRLDGQYGIYVNVKRELLGRQANLDQIQARLESALALVVSSNTKPIETVRPTAEQVVPKTQIIVSIALFAGCLIGLFSAMINYFSGNRPTSRQSHDL